MYYPHHFTFYTIFKYFSFFLILILNFVKSEISHLFVVKICTINSTSPPSPKGLKMAFVKPKLVDKINFKIILLCLHITVYFEI